MKHSPLPRSKSTHARSQWSSSVKTVALATPDVEAHVCRGHSPVHRSVCAHTCRYKRGAEALGSAVCGVGWRRYDVGV